MLESLVQEFETAFLALAALGAVLVGYGIYMSVRHGVPWCVEKLKGIKAAATADLSAVVADYHKIRGLIAADLSGFDQRVTALKAEFDSLEPRVAAIENLLKSLIPPKAGA